MTPDSPAPPIRLAIVGLGKIARDQHHPAIAGNAGFDLVDVLHAVALVDVGAPPVVLNVVFQLNAERPVVEHPLQPAIDLGAGEDKAAPLGERHHLFKGLCRHRTSPFCAKGNKKPQAIEMSPGDAPGIDARFHPSYREDSGFSIQDSEDIEISASRISMGCWLLNTSF